MHRIIYAVIIGTLFSVFCSSAASAAWLRNNDNLATINGTPYTAEDFMHWWDNWREAGNSFPDNPDKFIEWKLLAQEAASMELDQEPTFKQKLQVFYKVRTRILLKYDTVDSKIQISEKEIEDVYRSEYSPIWLISLLYFDSAEKAEAAYKDLQNKKYTFAELKKEAGAKGEPLMKESRFRPRSFKDNVDLLRQVEKLTVGEVSMPQHLGEYYVLLGLEEKTMPDENEFAANKENVRVTLWKERENLLTDQLINELRKKYAIQVDEELFALVNTDLDRETLSRPVVTSSRGNMPLWMLVNDVRKEYAMRNKKTWTEAEKVIMARGFLNGMIAEYLLTWEAEDRHYEEEPPFKWTYQFYQENRLIKEMENRLIRSQITVTDAEAEQDYKANLDEFRPPEKISVVLLTGEEKQIKQISMEILQGQDFAQVAEKFNLTPAPVKDIPVNQISPIVAEAVRDIPVGEVSEPFQFNDKYSLAKLTDRRIQEPKPFEKVKEAILAKLQKDKFSQGHQEYLAMLFEQSDIEINKKIWEKLRSENVN